MPEPTDTPTENGTKDVKAEGGDEDSKMVDPDETQTDAGAADSDDESEVNTKSRKNQRRRVQTEKQKRDEEREREREREKAAAQAAKQNPRSRELNKVLKEIAKKEEFIKQCEDEVAVIDNDLREADCPRTRVLGKDRFWNRYYWFERNGMPYAGLPTSSTASAGYANGCIWVQGPHELELEGYINLSSDLADEYRSRFDMTVAERKAVEEGRTGVSTAWQWGYISEPDDVDRLIRWLDTRGNRESKLRKELLAFHDQIVTNMTRRKEHLAAREAGKETGNDEGAASAAGKRASTRIRDKTPEAPDYHCLTWENTTALEELGHLHSEPPPPPRPRKQTKKREAANELDSKPAKTRRR